MNAARYLAAVDATWPAYADHTKGHWRIREGRGGGKRVSAASPIDAAAIGSIEEAVADMAALGQGPLFMVTPDAIALDTALADQGYDIVDPVWLYATPPAPLAAAEIPPVTTFESDRPLAIAREIWQAGGIGPARIAVMERAAGPKTYLLGRTNDRAAGCAYVAVSGGIAMLHALEVLPQHRGKGLGRHLMQAAAKWAVRQQADELVVLVTKGNAPANGLYASLGMTRVGEYWYRQKTGA